MEQFKNVNNGQMRIIDWHIDTLTYRHLDIFD